MTHTSQKRILGSFLIFGTLLALYLTINVGYDLFWVHKAWMYREGLIYKIGIAVLYADMPMLFIAGLTSTIFFLERDMSGDLLQKELS